MGQPANPKDPRNQRMMQSTLGIKYCFGMQRQVTALDCKFAFAVSSIVVGFDGAPGEPLRSMAVLKEIDWATSNCPLSWEAQGAWPGCGKGLGEGVPPYALPGASLDGLLVTLS